MLKVAALFALVAVAAAAPQTVLLGSAPGM
ncbi:unnamed protein product, partial [Allacma fusca]